MAARGTDGPRTFVTASAIGFYGYDRGDALLSEDSVRGDGFLADVVADWEAATAPAAEAGLRVVAVRTGIVQAARGGTLKLMRPLFAAGLGGRLGSGRQWLSWIGIDDLLDVYYRALYDDRLTGPVNAVAPNPVRNVDYTKALARTSAPSRGAARAGVRSAAAAGQQGARELAEANQRVLPVKLEMLGHRFRQPLVEDALAHQLGHALTRRSGPRSRRPGRALAWPRRRAPLRCGGAQLVGAQPERGDLGLAVARQPHLQQRVVELGMELEAHRCGPARRPGTRWPFLAISTAPGGTVERSKCHSNHGPAGTRSAAHRC